MYGLWSMLHLTSMDWHDRHFKEDFKSYGSIARILLFAVLAYYALIFVMKKRLVERWSYVKKTVAMLMKLTRKFHAPLAILSIGIIALHIVGAFLYGFKMDYTNISGLIAAFLLVGVVIAGVLRFRKLDRKWHLKLGLMFAVLFLLHAYL